MSRDGVITIRGIAAVIEQLPETQNARGEAIPGTPTTLATGMALIQPLDGRELFAAQQTFAEVTHRISWTPFVAGITPKMRVKAGGLVYDIGTVINVDTRSRELEMLAVRRGV
jgi:SPP1 family predicted phage head-tail adaptor